MAPPAAPWPSTAPDQPAASTDWAGLLAAMNIDRTVGVVDWCAPGAAAGRKHLDTFLQARLKRFATHRNDPNAGALSGVSPWLHYGQLAPQRCALEAQRHRSRHSAAVASFLEELIVRRELADNFCYYDDAYDKLYENKYDWCKTTLQSHAADPRPVHYTREQMEKAQTADDLWNAAQKEMVLTGKMHGFLRMVSTSDQNRPARYAAASHRRVYLCQYWAKKILEWTGPEEVAAGGSPPERALETALYLNDKYSMDGRDPNGAPTFSTSRSGRRFPSR